MEAIIVIVGFLGAGKTTLLKRLLNSCMNASWDPFVVLNDYENAHLDAEQLTEHIKPDLIKALNGNCICCSGIAELRESVNRIPERTNGITLIEANGTSDACALMGFLGVGLADRFLPPVQISVVDLKNWQQRGEHNELEANQIQVSSLILLTHSKGVATRRRTDVVNGLKTLNPAATILDADKFELSLISELAPSNNLAQKLDHQKAHWASCSIDLPSLPNIACINDICSALPASIVRAKGFAMVEEEKNLIYFERTPDGTIYTRPYNGIPTMGAKLLVVGPGSDSILLENLIAQYL